MVQVNGTTITMTRGDTARISVFINDESGESYNPGVGDKIRFAMKKNYKDASPLVLIDIPVDVLLRYRAYNCRRNCRHIYLQSKDKD